MAELNLISLSCNDRKPEDGHFGGWTTWERLMQSMAEQKKRPLAERIRPCLKFNDQWIYYCPTCQQCEEATWHLTIDGVKAVAKPCQIKGKRIELAVAGSGEVLTYVIGKGFEK